MSKSLDDIMELVNYWGTKGARLEPNKRGPSMLTIYPPDGGRPVGVHGTVSDHRHLKNLRAWGRQHGLPAFDNDKHVHPTLKDTMTDTLTLPSYMLEGNNEASTHRIAEIRGALEVVVRRGLPVEIGNIHSVLREHGRGFTASAQASKVIGKFLYRTGWRPAEARKNGMGSVFTWAYDPANGIAESYPNPLPEAVVWPDTDVQVEPAGLIEQVNAAADQGMPADELDAIEAAPQVDAEAKPVNPYTIEDVERWFEESVRLEGEVERLTRERDAARNEQGRAEAAQESSEREVSELESPTHSLVSEIETGRAEIESWKRGIDAHNDTIRNLREQVQIKEDAATYWREQHDNVRAALEHAQQNENPQADDGWWTVADEFTDPEWLAGLGLEARTQVRKK